MIRANAALTESTLACGFPRLSGGRPAVVDEGNDRLGVAGRRRRLGGHARVNRVPDRRGGDVAIRRPSTLECGQSRQTPRTGPGIERARCLRGDRSRVQRPAIDGVDIILGIHRQFPSARDCCDSVALASGPDAIQPT
jgi:hypothetical protein